MPRKPKEETTAEAAELLTEIENAERACRQSEAILLDRREQLKTARDMHEANVGRLRAAASARLESNPLFDRPDEEDEE